MNKRQVDFADVSGDFIKALPKGILLTSKADGQLNSMVIGWASVGVNWFEPIITVFVRESRHTRNLIEKNPEFTVNVPIGDFDKKIIKICGNKSGRDTDKIAEAGLTPVDADCVSVPGIKEFPLTFECKVVQKQLLDISALDADLVAKFYPASVQDENGNKHSDVHVIYQAKVLASYVIED